MENYDAIHEKFDSMQLKLKKKTDNLRKSFDEMNW